MIYLGFIWVLFWVLYGVYVRCDLCFIGVQFGITLDSLFWFYLVSISGVVFVLLSFLLLFGFYLGFNRLRFGHRFFCFHAVYVWLRLGFDAASMWLQCCLNAASRVFDCWFLFGFDLGVIWVSFGFHVGYMFGFVRVLSSLYFGFLFGFYVSSIFGF